MMIRIGLHSARPRRRAICVLACLLASVFVAAPAEANHNDPTALTTEDAVCGFVTDLDALLAEFATAGSFDSDRLNRALVRARAEVISAQQSASLPEVELSLRSFRAAMRELEKGASVPVSGSGFPDDLASFGSFMAQLLVEDLVVIAGNLGTVNGGVLDKAGAYLESGTAWRSSGVDEWERAVADFATAARILERELDIGLPCA